jgi:hypothetical protein
MSCKNGEEKKYQCWTERLHGACFEETSGERGKGKKKKKKKREKKNTNTW